MAEEVLATIEASQPRRIFGVSLLVVLGGLLLYVAFTAPPALHWQAFLVALGIGALYLAQRMWQATALVLELTETELREQGGAVLAQVAEVEKVERGAFAFKPSNGFIVKTDRPQARAWRPGLWWRSGRRLAVGGVTAGAQTRPVADMLAAMAAEQRG